MTSQREQLQALIAEIEAMLAKASPKLPWVVSNETAQQRKVLEKTRDYLLALQQSLDLSGGLGGSGGSEDGDSSLTAESSASAVLQALLQELQYLRTQTLQPLRLEIDTLQQARAELLGEVRQLELARQRLSQAPAALDQANLDQLFQALAERLESQVRWQIDQRVQQLDAEVIDNRLLSEEGGKERFLSGFAAGPTPEIEQQLPQLTPAQRLEQLKQVQRQSDDLVLSLDKTLRAVFEALQQSVYSYQDALAQGVDRMHTLGQQGEMMFNTLIGHLTEQLNQEQAASLEAARIRAGRSTQLPAGQDDLALLERVEAGGEPSLAAPEETWDALEALDLDVDFDQDEDITLFQLDDEITQLQLDGTEEEEPFAFQGDLEESTVIQTGPEPLATAGGALKDPLQVLGQLDAAEPPADALADEPGASTLAAGSGGEQGVREQALDDLYETLFGEDTLAAPPPLLGDDPFLTLPTVEANFGAPIGEADSTAAWDLAIAPSEATLPFPEGGQSAEEPTLDTLLFEAPPETSPVETFALEPRENESDLSDSLSTLDTVFGEELSQSLMGEFPESSTVAEGPETISSLAELLPEGTATTDTSANFGVKDIASLGLDAYVGLGEDTFVPASADEDLLATEELGITASYGLEFGESTLEQLDQDLSQLEAIEEPDPAPPDGTEFPETESDLFSDKDTSSDLVEEPERLIPNEFWLNETRRSEAAPDPEPALNPSPALEEVTSPWDTFLGDGPTAEIPASATEGTSDETLESFSLSPLNDPALDESALMETSASAFAPLLDEGLGFGSSPAVPEEPTDSLDFFLQSPPEIAAEPWLPTSEEAGVSESGLPSLDLQAIVEDLGLEATEAESPAVSESGLTLGDLLEGTEAESLPAASHALASSPLDPEAGESAPSTADTWGTDLFETIDAVTLETLSESPLDQSDIEVDWLGDDLFPDDLLATPSVPEEAESDSLDLFSAGATLETDAVAAASQAEAALDLEDFIGDLTLEVGLEPPAPAPEGELTSEMRFEQPLDRSDASPGSLPADLPSPEGVAESLSLDLLGELDLSLEPVVADQPDLDPAADAPARWSLESFGDGLALEPPEPPALEPLLEPLLEPPLVPEAPEAMVDLSDLLGDMPNRLEDQGTLSLEEPLQTLSDLTVPLEGPELSEPDLNPDLNTDSAATVEMQEGFASDWSETVQETPEALEALWLGDEAPLAMEPRATPDDELTVSDAFDQDTLAIDLGNFNLQDEVPEGFLAAESDPYDWGSPSLESEAFSVNLEALDLFAEETESSLGMPAPESLLAEDDNRFSLEELPLPEGNASEELETSEPSINLEALDLFAAGSQSPVDVPGPESLAPESLSTEETRGFSLEELSLSVEAPVEAIDAGLDIPEMPSIFLEPETEPIWDAELTAEPQGLDGLTPDMPFIFAEPEPAPGGESELTANPQADLDDLSMDTLSIFAETETDPVWEFELAADPQESLDDLTIWGNQLTESPMPPGPGAGLDEDILDDLQSLLENPPSSAETVDLSLDPFQEDSSAFLEDATLLGNLDLGLESTEPVVPPDADLTDADLALFGGALVEGDAAPPDLALFDEAELSLIEDEATTAEAIFPVTAAADLSEVPLSDAEVPLPPEAALASTPSDLDLLLDEEETLEESAVLEEIPAAATTETAFGADEWAIDIDAIASHPPSPDSLDIPEIPNVPAAETLATSDPCPSEAETFEPGIPVADWAELDLDSPLNRQVPATAPPAALPLEDAPSLPEVLPQDLPSEQPTPVEVMPAIPVPAVQATPGPAPVAWYLGLDIGTTGLSAVLLNQTAGQVYPLYWVDNTVSGATADKFFRLPTIGSLALAPAQQDVWRLQSVGSSALTVNWDEGSGFTEGENESISLLLKNFKPLLKLGIPYQDERGQEEPQVQWSETVQVPLQAAQASLQALLATLLVQPGAQSPLTAGAVGLEPTALGTALAQLQGVIVSYPANWSDTYSFNLREAILAAGLAQRPDQIYLIEDAIAAVLSGLPNPADRGEAANAQPLRQQTLYACNWSGGTVVISAGAALTELGVVNLPRALSRLEYGDFGLHSLAYAGDAIDLDIIAHLLHPTERRQPRSGPAPREVEAGAGWGWQTALPELEQANWADLNLDGLEMPRIAEPDLPLRYQLLQRMESSLLGQSALEAARHLKLILQHQNQFELKLADQRWLVRRKDLDNRIVLPYIQRINGHLNRLMSQAALSAQGINQVICTGGTASLPAITRWLRQKFPNATIIQDTYPNNRPPSCSRVAYGLVNLVRYPQVLDLNRHQYSDNFLLMELVRTFPDQPMPLNGILHLLEQRGLNTQACELHLIALLEGRLPPGLVPTAADVPPLSQNSLATETVQALNQAPLFTRQNGQIYVPNAEQCQRLLTYLEALLTGKHQRMEEPLLAQLGAAVPQQG